jgi:FkbM family methyltransferase
MILDLKLLKQKYDLQIKGVLHVGAHFGHEYKTYEEMGIENVIFFEPSPSTFLRLKENVGDKATLVNVALGNTVGEIAMNVESANQGQSNSILEPAAHLTQYPDIRFEGKIKVKITKLDTFIEEQDNHNFINIDVQGYELEVLKGGVNFLKYVDYVMSEVNRAELYKDCVQIKDLDAFLGKHSFTRVEVDWGGQTWGDAFYIKNNKMKKYFLYKALLKIKWHRFLSLFRLVK